MSCGFLLPRQLQPVNARYCCRDRGASRSKLQTTGAPLDGYVAHFGVDIAGAAGDNHALVYRSPRWRNWQTRQLEGLVGFGPWRFESSPGQSGPSGAAVQTIIHPDLALVLLIALCRFESCVVGLRFAFRLVHLFLSATRYRVSSVQNQAPMNHELNPK